jgi:hypothetical protein
VAEELFEQIRLYLPKYLTPEENKELFSELKKFPESKNFYMLSTPPADLLQGDGWTGCVVVNFDSLEKRPVSGMLLSNSCDVDIRNPRVHNSKVLFAPLIRLSGFQQLLFQAGKNEEQINSTMESIRRQTTTYIFYLPSIPGTMDESIILLDDIHNQPLQDFLKTKENRLFTLNPYAFYIFLIKLSIHFCRFQEGVSRF